MNTLEPLAHTLVLILSIQAGDLIPLWDIGHLINPTDGDRAAAARPRAGRDATGEEQGLFVGTDLGARIVVDTRLVPVEYADLRVVLDTGPQCTRGVLGLYHEEGYQVVLAPVAGLHVEPYHWSYRTYGRYADQHGTCRWLAGSAPELPAFRLGMTFIRVGGVSDE